MHLNLTNIRIQILRFSIILFLFYGCKKEDIRENIDTPLISIKKVSPSIVQEFTQSVLLEVAYEDGNGDLGFQDPDILSLSVHDSRLSEADMYHIPPLAPNGEEVYIKGTFNIYLNTTFLIGVGSSERLTYTVKVKDRAGNWSNTVTSEEITIVE
ncbi:MAG: hypothetical protein H8E84_04160 [Flavobacteriales bacterium]|nr:hypothetical protein [Flavobacteriales bacterium]